MSVLISRVQRYKLQHSLGRVTKVLVIANPSDPMDFRLDRLFSKIPRQIQPDYTSFQLQLLAFFKKYEYFDRLSSLYNSPSFTLHGCSPIRDTSIPCILADRVRSRSIAVIQFFKCMKKQREHVKYSTPQQIHYTLPTHKKLLPMKNIYKDDVHDGLTTAE